MNKTNSPNPRTVARAGLVAGVVAVVLTALAAVLSFTALLDAAPFRNLLGVAAFAAIPAALAGISCGTLGLAGDRRAVLVGLVLSGASILAWLVMLFMTG